jgi:hypothetical protein
LTREEREILGALRSACGTGHLYKSGLVGQGVCGAEINFLHDLPPKLFFQSKDIH